MSADVATAIAWDVRREQPRDVTAVHALVAAAFGDDRVAALLTDMRGDHCWQDLSFVVTPAADPDVVIGHVAFTRGWVDTPKRLLEVLILSPMSVHPGWQGRGAGTALLRRSMAQLATREEPLVFLEGSPTYYGRVGFEPAMALGFTRPSVRIPERAFQVWRLPAGSSAQRLTGALVYPDVFWRHDAVGLR